MILETLKSMGKRWFALPIAALILLAISTAAAETDYDYHYLYETPESWCKELVITVSGNDVSSENYFLNDCGEFESNKWYCNCKDNKEFDVTFINREGDLHSYVIDIKSGSNNVRRVVSANAFLQKSQNETAEKTNTSVVNVVVDDTKAKELEQKIKNLENRINNLPQGTAGQVVTSIHENPYDDTALNESITRLEQKVDKNSETFKKAGVFLFVVVVGLGVVAIQNEKWKRDVTVQSNRDGQDENNP